jgi:hypothetical protein
MNHRCTFRRFALVVLFVVSSGSAALAVPVWVGGVSSDLLDANNWDTLAVPGATEASDFVNNFSVNPNPTVTGVWNPKFISFGDENLTSHTPGEGGPARTFSGTGTITIATGGALDTWLASGDITFDNAELRLTRAASLYAASGTDAAGADGASNLIINTTVFKMGVGGSSGSPILGALGGDITIVPVVDFTEATANRNLLLRPSAGRTITLTNGVAEAVRLTGLRTQGLGGRTVLGNSTTWTGTIGIMGSDLEINHSTSLGAGRSGHTRRRRQIHASSIGNRRRRSWCVGTDQRHYGR